jgi:hypothetical protein
MTKTQINWRNPNQKISEFFTVGEVTKGDARRIPSVGSEIEGSILQLALELDKIREGYLSTRIRSSGGSPLSRSPCLSGGFIFGGRISKNQ